MNTTEYRESVATTIRALQGHLDVGATDDPHVCRQMQDMALLDVLMWPIDDPAACACELDGRPDCDRTPLDREKCAGVCAKRKALIRVNGVLLRRLVEAETELRKLRQGGAR
jgi:hypothetical protein